MASSKALRETSTPKQGADEIRRVNRLIESRLEGNGKLAVAYPFPTDAYLFVLYREVFGPAYGNGPEPLTAEEAAIPIKLGTSLTDRGMARRASLNVLKLLATSMTQWPDKNGLVDQSHTEERLGVWLRNTTPAVDPPFTSSTSTISSLPIPSPRLPSTSINPIHQRMDNLSEAGGVSLGPHSYTPYRHNREISLEENAPIQTLHEDIRPIEQDIDQDGNTWPTEQAISIDVPQSVYSTQVPMPTEQLRSHDQTSPRSQAHNIFAPKPLSTQQPLFLNTQTLEPSPVPLTAPTAVPSYVPIPYASVGWTHNPGYQHTGYNQVPPPFAVPGQIAPHFPVHGQAGPHLPSHAPWVYQIQAPLQPFYGPIQPMPSQQPFGYSQALPFAGGPPIYVPQSMIRRQEMGPSEQATPMQPRMTLPPAERQATSSAWAVPKTFNIAEWAQENRPSTPAKTAETKQTVDPRALPADSRSVIPIIRYRFGTARMYPVSTKGAISSSLQNLTSPGSSSLEKALEPDLFPFENPYVSGGPPPWGVVHIGNIPYGIQRMELYEFLGSNTKLLTPSMGWPIHIILDRLTGKTMDCYVELASVDDAQQFVNDRNRQGYPNKLGDRVVTITMSTQDELLAQTFGRARNVEWRGGMPVITESTDPYNSGFKGYLTPEELVRLIQLAEFPHRSGYTSKNLQRPYECMISILYKFPWYAADTYTIGQRNQIFAATNDLVRILLTHIHRRTDPYLHQTILEELLYAGLNAAGFSENQRWQLCKTAEQIGRAIRISPLAKDWPFEVLSRKLDVPEDLMNYYVDLLTKHLDRRGVRPTMNPFRTFLLPPSKGDRFEATAKEQGELELKCVLDIYRMTLPKEGEKAALPKGKEALAKGKGKEVVVPKNKEEEAPGPSGAAQRQ